MKGEESDTSLSRKRQLSPSSSIALPHENNLKDERFHLPQKRLRANECAEDTEKIGSAVNATLFNQLVSARNLQQNQQHSSQSDPPNSSSSGNLVSQISSLLQNQYSLPSGTAYDLGNVSLWQDHLATPVPSPQLHFPFFWKNLSSGFPTPSSSPAPVPSFMATPIASPFPFYPGLGPPPLPPALRTQPDLLSNNAPAIGGAVGAAAAADPAPASADRCGSQSSPTRTHGAPAARGGDANSTTRSTESNDCDAENGSEQMPPANSAGAGGMAVNTVPLYGCGPDDAQQGVTKPEPYFHQPPHLAPQRLPLHYSHDHHTAETTRLISTNTLPQSLPFANENQSMPGQPSAIPGAQAKEASHTYPGTHPLSHPHPHSQPHPQPMFNHFSVTTRKMKRSGGVAFGLGGAPGFFHDGSNGGEDGRSAAPGGQGSECVPGAEDQGNISTDQLRKRRKHNMVEQKRREFMNSQIDKLRVLVPSCTVHTSKCDAISQAILYIEELQELLLKHAIPLPPKFGFAMTMNSFQPTHDSSKANRPAAVGSKEDGLSHLKERVAAPSVPGRVGPIAQTYFSTKPREPFSHSALNLNGPETQSLVPSQSAVSLVSSPQSQIPESNSFLGTSWDSHNNPSSECTPRGHCQSVSQSPLEPHGPSSFGGAQAGYGTVPKAPSSHVPFSLTDTALRNVISIDNMLLYPLDGHQQQANQGFISAVVHKLKESEANCTLKSPKQLPDMSLNHSVSLGWSATHSFGSVEGSAPNPGHEHSSSVSPYLQRITSHQHQGGPLSAPLTPTAGRARPIHSLTGKPAVFRRVTSVPNMRVSHGNTVPTSPHTRGEEEVAPTNNPNSDKPGPRPRSCSSPPRPASTEKQDASAARLSTARGMAAGSPQDESPHPQPQATTPKRKTKATLFQSPSQDLVLLA
eukprot:GCRY01004000.1.p1 GENE.GCRY01004000.1~~GCRY01004000.1.p1  ORF type:complete len:915 (+),score=137.65 GCRY01004000.1:219-2963(+)